jgi:hypothetical protein
LSQVIFDFQLPIADLIFGLRFLVFCEESLIAESDKQTQRPKAEGQIGNWQLEIESR